MGRSLHLRRCSPGRAFQWREVAPYNVVQMYIEEAPNVIITGNAIDIDNSELKVGLPLEVVFDQVTPEDTLPRWRLRRD